MTTFVLRCPARCTGITNKQNHTFNITDTGEVVGVRHEVHFAETAYGVVLQRLDGRSQAHVMVQVDDEVYEHAINMDETIADLQAARAWLAEHA